MAGETAEHSGSPGPSCCWNSAAHKGTAELQQGPSHGVCSVRQPWCVGVLFFLDPFSDQFPGKMLPASICQDNFK